MSAQGTDEWFAARLGKVTASRIADVMAKPRGVGGGGVRQNYMDQLILERLTGKRTEGFLSDSMAWGQSNEHRAREEYSRYRDIKVDLVGFIDHPNIRWAGASPDGIVGSQGLLEIKCPNTNNHLKIVNSDKIPSRYVLQMMWQMCVMQRNWCDFVSYDPRLDDQRRMFVKRLTFDSIIVEQIESEVINFLSELETNQFINDLNLKENSDSRDKIERFLHRAIAYDKSSVSDSSPQSDILALKYYKLAAEGGNATAQYNLGYKYSEGEGVPRDDEAAAYWYRLAAKQGDRDAQCNLGYAYEAGLGVEANLNLALFWYAQAAEQSEPNALENLRRLVPSYDD
jgi:putative phage-type endonuclease